MYLQASLLPINRDICAESVTVMKDHVFHTNYSMCMLKYVCICAVGGHSLVPSSRSALAVELCDPGGSVERGMHFRRNVQKKVSKVRFSQIPGHCISHPHVPFSTLKFMSCSLTDGNEIKWIWYDFQNPHVEGSLRLKGASQAWVIWLLRPLALAVVCYLVLLST